tara:strand:+ start:45 stop:269 length:225 start_codon:yes stop_codon:yes gene_type:complete
MSHWSKDAIADRIIDDVAAMSDVQVCSALSKDNLKKVAGFTGDKVNGANIMDFARDVLMDQLFDNWIDMPGPHG